MPFELDKVIIQAFIRERDGKGRVVAEYVAQQPTVVYGLDGLARWERELKRTLAKGEKPDA